MRLLPEPSPGSEKRSARTGRYWTSVLHVVFRDRLGIVVFLTGIAFFFIYWRIGLFLNDSNTVANTLVAVADGHLHLSAFPHGPPESPGTSTVDGRIYGRNYGQVAFALPFYWAIEAIAAVTDLRIALVGLWSLTLLALAYHVGVILHREFIATTIGAVVAFGLFLANIALATPIVERMHTVVALQLSTIVAASLVGVVLYRLLADKGSRVGGLFAGLVAMVATPVGFWASLPKRHVLVALLALCIIYLFHRSTVVTEDRRWRYRALAYAGVGLTTWVSAPEGFLLFIALGTVDILVARRTELREMMVVGAVFAISLVPFFLTNILLSGNPLRPPLLLPNYIPPVTGTSAGGEAGSLATQQNYSPPSDADIEGPIKSIIKLLVGILSTYIETPAVLIEKITKTFVRSGYIEGETQVTGGEAITLTVLESMPLAGVLFGAPVLLGRHLYRTRSIRRSFGLTLDTTDWLVVVYSLVLTFFYLPRLPGHAQITVRYFVPMYPLICYSSTKLLDIDEILTEHWQAFGWTYMSFVLIGSQFLFVFMLISDARLGEAFQLHALLGLFGAIVVGAVTIGARWFTVPKRWQAIGLAVASAVGTAFLLLTGLDHLAYTFDYALGISKFIATATTL